MKKLFIILILLFIASPIVKAEADYEQLYQEAELFDTTLFNNIDPWQDEDALKYAWSPYPLFRTSSYLYFKDIKISPGYYLLTPRKLKDKDYVLFKENGKVSFIVPVVKKELTPLMFYATNTPKKKQTKMNALGEKIAKKFYQTARDSKRIPPPSSLIDVEEDDVFIIIKLYYGEHCYIMIFKRNQF